MSLRGTRCARGLVYAVVLAATALAVALAGSAHGAYYKMVLCAGNNGSNGFGMDTNTRSAQNPGGIFSIENYCGPAPYPAGNNAFIRIVENQAAGNAGNGAFGRVWWSPPYAIAIAAGGGYTRQPNAFNDGWRARFWAEGYDGSMNNILMQGAGVANGSLGGIGWATTPSFAPHLWPFGGYGHYRSFVYELTCVRPAGCDRANFNAVDANTFVLTLNDVVPSSAALTNTGSPLMTGAWVRGTQDVTWNVADTGSGMRFDRLRVDGALLQQNDWRGACNIDAHGESGEFARDFQPCPAGGPWGRVFPLNTAALGDGAHTVQVCAQDYAQTAGIGGSGGESCDQRTIRTDNTAPPAPAGLHVITPNPGRYSSNVRAIFSLPANQGSPITRVHYDVIDAAGKQVVAEKVLSGTNPTEIKEALAPQLPGEYRLRVWLEDQVGWQGPVATAALPRDTVPPAAPQHISVTAPETPRSREGFDVRWVNIVDAGSPISGVRYQVLNAAGEVVVPTQAIDAANVEAIRNLQAPGESGAHQLRLWLIDGEGNVGAPATVPLSYSCVRSQVSGGEQLSAGFGGAAETLVQQDEGASLGGALRGAEGPLGGAAICVFSRVVTDHARQFVGLAMTAPDGSYRFSLAPGPSRELTALYRPDAREISATALLRTQVRPTLKTPSGVVRNKSFAYFEGEIPGPHNNRVVIVLQVRSGKGWLAFRRYRTRDNGKYSLRYHFRRTLRPTTYEMRAQVRQTAGYPYEQGDSAPLRLRVVPGPRCGKKNKKKGKACARKAGKAGKKRGSSAR